MKILVIIVTYNAMQWAERCLGSLYSSTIIPDVFVVDNGSTDGTQEYIQKNFPHVIFRQSKENIGFGKANNLGLQYALDNNYDYAYLLNQDAWVMEDTFEKLIGFSQESPEYGILSPFQMNADVETVDEKFVECIYNSQPQSQLFSDMYNNKLKAIYPISRVMAAHWLLPVSTIKQVGGFSPSFTHYGEDYNYIDRASFKGMKVGIVPMLRVVHDRGGRWESKEKKLYLIYVNYIQLLSNPEITTMRAFVILTHETVKCIMKYQTLIPLWNWWKILFNLHSILKDKKISMNMNGAFLKHVEPTKMVNS